MKKPSNAANRWWIVFGATISMLVAQGPVIIFTLGLFIGPISDEFGWDRANISLAGGAAGLCSALTVPIIGILMDRWGVRRVLIPAIAAFGASRPWCRRGLYLRVQVEASTMVSTGSAPPRTRISRTG